MCVSIKGSDPGRLSNFSIPGPTLRTGWHLDPPPKRVNFNSLLADADPNWTSYHTAFKPSGFRRAYSYVKNFIPTQLPSQTNFVEQWIVPGWDCTPTGSRDPSQKEARWTNNMIQFIADMNLPVQENFTSPKPGQKPPLGSVAATLAFALAQRRARDRGEINWRDLEDDGHDLSQYKNSHVHVSLSLTTETKKRLPPEGVRWLYLRSEIKSVQQGRMDLEVLVFDEGLELVAISHQVAQMIPPVDKKQRKANL